jgi:hypothetical protein
LNRIEQRQLLQHRLIEDLHESQTLSRRLSYTWNDCAGEYCSQFLQLSTISPAATSAPAATVAAVGAPQSEAKGDFDAAFVALMDAYGRLSPPERAARIRRIVQVSTAAQVSHISELVDMFSSEGLGRELGHEARPPQSQQ